MGMPIVVDVRDDVDDRRGSTRVFDWLRWVDATFSTYKEDSEISRLNRGELALEPTPIRTCARCSRAARSCASRRTATSTSGPPRWNGIDPSGLVKGWSVDRAAAILDEAGARNYAINAGGDMLPARPRRCPSRAGASASSIRCVRERVAAVVEANDLAVATSGAYARGEHVVDPHTGSAADRRPLGDDRPAPISAPPTPTPPPPSRWEPPGRTGRPAPARLRGDDDPRRRGRALDRRLPVRVTVPVKML